MPILSTGSSNEAGFTLIELMITMVIIIFAAFIIVPNAGSFLKAREADSAAASLIRLAQLAREEAVDQALPFRLIYDSELRKLSVAKDEAVSSLMTYTLPRGYSLEAFSAVGGSEGGGADIGLASGWSVEFKPDGTCSGAEIILERDLDSSNGTVPYVIDIDAVTGEASRRQAEDGE